jgi:predicted aspartyl protease
MLSKSMKKEARIKRNEERTTSHDTHLKLLLLQVLNWDLEPLHYSSMSTRTSAIWKNMYDAVLYKPQARTFLGPTLSDRLDTVEGEIERRSDRLAQLHEERYLDNVAQKQGLDQRIPREWKLPGYGVPWHDCWGKIKTLLEPEYNREWHNAVAETKKLLALARDDANRLRGSILRSRINQLEQLVSDRSQSRPIYPASEPFIEGQLNETEISAFPDTGAAANFISLQYAEAHGLEIDRKSSSLVKLGNGSTVSTLGTTTALFSFAGEKTTRSLLFNVLRTSVYDVVLGSPFLQATETLTRYAHRIGRKCREAFSHRVCALGASQRVNGRLNGVHLDATPDTGSDVSLMPASLAARHKLKVNTDKQHLVLLEFADGSTARATGLVEDVEWAYGDTGIPYRIDVYVLPGLSVDLLFGYDFLHDTNAFVAHEADFWSGDDVEKQAVADEVAITWLFWIIKLARKAVKDQRNWGSRKSSSHCSVSRHHELT